LQIHTTCIRNNALHDLGLIKLTVARFVGIGSLTGYINGHTKETYPIKEVPQLFLKSIIPLIEK